MDVLLQDLRYAWGSLRRTPGFTLTVILVLALGIGVNSMIYTMVYGVMLRPWPLPDPERIMSVRQLDPKGRNSDLPLSWQNFRDFQEQSKSFTHLGAYWEERLDVALGQDPERLRAAAITSGVFPALGVAPVLGRNFRRDEEILGSDESQVIISDRLWRDRFGADPKVLGQALRVNGRKREIVGVMGPKFQYPTTQDLWIPAGYDAVNDHRQDHGLLTVGRLKPGVSVQQAEAEMQSLMSRLTKQYPDELGSETVVVRNAREQASRSVRPIMWMMIVAVVLVLLIASANVANLMLARATARRREISLRMALGASRGRIVRQLFTESVLLAMVGAGTGLALAAWGNRQWIGAISGETPFYIVFRMDAPVLLYTVVIAFVAATACGLAPALHASDGQLIESIREGTNAGGASRSGNRVRHGLVVAEIAFSLVLLVGSGLMIRSFMHLEQAGAALRTEGALTAQVALPDDQFPDESSRRNFLRELASRLRTQPGVSEFSVVDRLPLGQGSSKVRALPDGMGAASQMAAHWMNHLPVLPGYFQLIGMSLERGRDFTDADREGTEGVVIVSHAAAQQLWPGEDPIGKRLRFQGELDSAPGRRVIGVAPDIAQEERGNNSTMSSIYLSQMQAPSARFVVLVRSSQPSTVVATALRQVVKQVAPDLALTDVRTLREALRFQLGMRRLFSSLMVVFGVMALVIAVLGLYGVMAYSVAQRTQELGIRMALGADRSRVVRMVLLQAMRLVTLGCAIGLVVALVVTRGMSSLLTGVTTTEPLTYAAVCILLLLAGVAAAIVPAVRATRVDPMVALKGS